MTVTVVEGQALQAIGKARLGVFDKVEFITTLILLQNLRTRIYIKKYITDNLTRVLSTPALSRG